MVLTLLGGAATVAVGASCALVLVIHFSLGGASPGILAVAKDGLRFWIPLVFTLIALWLVGTCARVILLARRRASASGLSLLKYFDLTPEQKLQLPESHQEIK
jgi:hypothetical protein